MFINKVHVYPLEEEIGDWFRIKYRLLWYGSPRRAGTLDNSTQGAATKDYLLRRGPVSHVEAVVYDTQSQQPKMEVFGTIRSKTVDLPVTGKDKSKKIEFSV